MRWSTLIVLVTFALATLPTPANAHVDTFSEAKTLTVGPYSVYGEPGPAPIFAGKMMSYSAIITDKRTGGFASDVEVRLNVTSPNGSSRAIDLKPDQSGYHVGGMVVTERGNHTATITIKDAEATHRGETWFEVYPDLPVRFRPAEATLDAYSGTRTPLRMEIYDPETDTAANLADVTMRVEHWSDDHTTLLGADELPMRQEAGAIWVATYTFPKPGMYHLRFASDAGGFTYADVPLLHMYALEPAPQNNATNETPLAPLMALGVLGVAALALRRKG